MDVNKAINDLLAERELKAAAEIEAHNRIIVIDRTVRKLERAKQNIEQILNGKEGLETSNSNLLHLL